MSWKPEFLVIGNGDKWAGNGERYATQIEAERSAFARSLAWTAVLDWRVAESTDKVTCRMENGRSVFIEDEKATQ